MAGEVNYGLVNPAVLDYAGQEQKTLNVQKSRLDVQRLEEERKLMLGMQKQLADSGQDPDLNIIFDTMIKSGNPEYMSKGLEGKSKLKEQQEFAKIMGYGDTAAPPAPTAPGSFGTPMAPSAEPTSFGGAPAPTNALTAMPGARPAAPANALATSALNQAETVDKINRLLATGNPRAIQAAQVLQSQLKTEAPRAGIVVGAKGTLVNPVTGEVIFRNTASEGGGGLAAELGLSKKDLQKREASFSRATQAIKTVEAKSKTLLEDIESLKNHPGLDEITGIAGGRLPGYSSNGRAAKAIYDRIVARGGFTELQDMRNASPTGGALGNVSNQENQSLRDAWAAISRIQDAKDLRTQLTRAQNDVTGSVQRIREAYDSDYEYKAKAPDAAPKTPSTTPSAGGNTVTTPDGKVFTFPTAEAASQFRKNANIKD
jgi:hypothetical protein